MTRFCYKKLNMLGFEIDELKQFLNQRWKNAIRKELDKRGLELYELHGKQSLIVEIVNCISEKGLRDKEYIELFAALEFCFLFFKDNPKIFYILKPGINPEEAVINELDDLKKLIKEDDLTDFTIINEGGARKYQLKQYQHELETENLAEYIKTKLHEYANDMGDVNLLILLQGERENKNNKWNIDFQVVHEKIMKVGYSFPGQVLISYNEQNKKNIVYQIYPEFNGTYREIAPEDLNNWFRNKEI